MFAYRSTRIESTYLGQARREAADRLLPTVLVGFTAGAFTSWPSWVSDAGFAWGALAARGLAFLIAIILTLWVRRAPQPWLLDVLVPIGMTATLALGVVETMLVGGPLDAGFVSDALVLLLFSTVLVPGTAAMVGVVFGQALVALVSLQLDAVPPLVTTVTAGGWLTGGAAAILVTYLLERSVRKRHRAVRRLRRVASVDPLTALLNRRAFLEQATLILQRHRADRLPVSLLFLDLDHFKCINDVYGHAAGDALLVHVAERLKTLCRPQDVVCREGGEEFVVLLPSADEQVAMHVAERVKRGVPLNAPHAVTISAGVACIAGDETLHGALRRADEALYVAKNLGRNRVVLAPTPP